MICFACSHIQTFCKKHVHVHDTDDDVMMVTPIVMGIMGVYVGDVCDVCDVCNAHQPESANVSLAQLPLWRPYPQCVKCILNI